MNKEEQRKRDNVHMDSASPLDTRQLLNDASFVAVTIIRCTQIISNRLIELDKTLEEIKNR